MKLIKHSLAAVLLLGATAAWSDQAVGKAAQEVLVQVGDEAVTVADLKRAIQSSPYATQFNTLDAEAQAEVRGAFLRRLVALRLLRREAQAQGLERDERFEREAEEYRLAQLYRAYTRKLREQVRLPEEVEKRIRSEYKGQRDAMTAALAAERVGRYKELKTLTLRHWRDRLHVVFHEERIRPEASADTVLMEGDDGLEIRYGDLLDDAAKKSRPTKEWIEDRLYKRAEFLIFAKAAEREGVDVSRQMAAFRQERLPAMLMEKLERQWAPDDKTLKAYYDSHPELSKVPASWHVGQLVLSSYAQAAAMRKRILAGESLFELAGRYSIDPYGRAHNGDMGWIQEGQGSPALEAELNRMADGEVSKVIRSTKGYNLVTVLQRRPAKKRSFRGMKDRVRQALIQDKYAAYLGRLSKKYHVEWKLLADAKVEREGD